jgi:hypothetical protein
MLAFVNRPEKEKPLSKKNRAALLGGVVLTLCLFLLFLILLSGESIPEDQKPKLRLPFERKTIEEELSKKFPEHWGEPPQIQTRDFRHLPGGYGTGSGTLAKWIRKNLEADGLL